LTVREASRCSLAQPTNATVNVATNNAFIPSPRERTRVHAPRRTSPRRP
jgi:hypothetical protein